MASDEEDIRTLEISVRMEKNRANELDLTAIAALKFDKLVKLFHFLYTEATELYGSDMADASTSALAEQMLAESRMVEAIANVHIARIKYRHVIAGAALAEMQKATSYVPSRDESRES